MRPTTTENSMDAGKSLTVLMQVNEVSGADLARHLGISPQLLQRMKSTKKMNGERIKQLAEFFVMTQQEFLNVARRPLTTAMMGQREILTASLDANHPNSRRANKRIRSLMSEVVEKIQSIESGDAI